MGKHFWQIERALMRGRLPPGDPVEEMIENNIAGVQGETIEHLVHGNL